MPEAAAASAAYPGMLLLYSALLYLAVPLVLARLLWLGLKDPGYLHRWRERFGHIETAAAAEPVIWIHAVSVGEVQAARPLLEYLREQHPGNRLLLTTTTPGGARTVQRLYGPGIEHRYFPYDLPHVIRRFLGRLRPRLLIVMETEIWPNLYHQCRRRGIPVALVNARLSEQSCRGYRRLAGLTRGTLECLSLIAVQSRADADRFLSLGARPETVRVTGNLKFDLAPPHSVSEAGEVMRRLFSVSRPVWIAASTHEGEERQVLEAFRQVLADHPGCLLVLAPRHPERAADIVELCERAGFQTARHSERGGYTPATQVYVLDTLGELPVLYAAADLAFVGGSLVRHGGHNMLEPASLGLAVVTGRHVFNFTEITGILAAAGALEQVSTVNELAGKVSQLLEDANLRHAMGERGRQVVRDNQGTLTRLIESLKDTVPLIGSQ